MTQFKKHHIGNQKGFSLFIALIFVAFFGSVLTGFVYSRSGESLRDEAEITGWQIGKLARAARVFVRDEYVANPNLRAELALSGPRDIPVEDLIEASLLPTNFARTSGSEAFTALGQEIRVIMANYPLDGDPSDLRTIPTAYIFLANNHRTSGSLVQDIVQAARRQNVAISAPLFDPDGNNMSGTCNGGPSVVIWDTGCMSEEEFTRLTGEPEFAVGSLVVPAWRSVNFDTRILMRFPQPEGTGASTMLTELEMGDPLADCDTNPNSRIKIPSDTDGTTELCGAMSDDVAQADNALADRRRDMLNTRNLEAQTYVAYGQTGMGVVIEPGTNARINKTQNEVSLNVDGGVVATGDMKTFGGNMTLSGNIGVDRNIAVPTNDDGVVKVTARIGGTLTANTLTSTELEVMNPVSTDARVRAQDVFASGGTSVGNVMVTDNMYMNGNGSTITTTGGANMLGETNINAMTVTGASAISNYTYVTGELNTSGLAVNSNVNAAKSAYIGRTTTERVDVTNGGSANCRGDCPLRTRYAIEQGALNGRY